MKKMSLLRALVVTIAAMGLSGGIVRDHFHHGPVGTAAVRVARRAGAGASVLLTKRSVCAGSSSLARLRHADRYARVQS